MKSKQLTRDEAAAYILAGMMASGDWPEEQKANVHFNTKTVTETPTDIKEVIVTVTIKPLYTEEDILWEGV